MNLGEIVNEVCIVLTAYHLFLFSDYVTLPEDELIFGWSVICLILFNVLFNLVVFIFSLLRNVKRSCLKKLAIREAKRRLEIKL